MEKIVVQNFVAKSFSSELWPQIVSCWRNTANNFFLFCSTMLVLSIDISLVIMFFKFLKKLWWNFTRFIQKKNFPKNLHFNNISNVHHIQTTEHFLSSEGDKQLHTQIQHYCLTFKKCCRLHHRGVYVRCYNSSHFSPLPFQSHNVLITCSFTDETVSINDIQNHFHVICIM